MDISNVVLDQLLTAEQKRELGSALFKQLLAEIGGVQINKAQLEMDVSEAISAEVVQRIDLDAFAEKISRKIQDSF